MGSVSRIETIGVDEYLAGEEFAEVRHEYVAGSVYAMVGATARHNRIARRLCTMLDRKLAGSPCEAFISDMKVRAGDAFYYPDVVVDCSSPDPEATYLTSPVLIAEVLSESTEGRDRLEKWAAYRGLPGLREYVLVAQDRPSLEVLRRADDGWDRFLFEEDDRVAFASVQLDFPLRALYADDSSA